MLQKLYFGIEIHVRYNNYILEAGILKFVYKNVHSFPLLQIHQETFGKSGCRRIVPGQYLAVDPKGRAIMIGMLYFFSYMYA